MKTKLKILILTVLISTSMLYTGCKGDETPNKKNSTKTIVLEEKPKSEYVNAKVYDKTYIEAENKIIMLPVSIGKGVILTPHPQHIDAKFNTILVYDDITTTIDDKELYYKVKKGDTIKVKIYKSWFGHKSLELQ